MKAPSSPYQLGSVVSEPVSVNEAVREPLPALTVVPPGDPEVTPESPYAIKAREDGQFPECYAVLSPQDHKRFAPYKWTGTRNGRLFRWIKDAKVAGGRRPIWLHRAVVSCHKDKFVRILSGDERDLRRHNLRVVLTKEETRHAP